MVNRFTRSTNNFGSLAGLLFAIGSNGTGTSVALALAVYIHTCLRITVGPAGRTVEFGMLVI